MKTRYEIIYDFMLALSSNNYIREVSGNAEDFAESVYEHAQKLADKYFEAGVF
jgi:hypothetical protein